MSTSEDQAKMFAEFRTELDRLVEQFGRNISHYKSASFDEASLRQEFLNPFFRALGWDVENKAGRIPQHRQVEIESRTQIAGRQKRADYLFRTHPTDRFVCEAKRPAQELHAGSTFQAKRYAWNKGLPLAVLTDFEEMKVFVVGGKPHKDEPDVGLWKTYHFRQYPLVADELWKLLSRERVEAGSIDDLIAALPKRPTGAGRTRQQWLIKPDRARALDADFLNFLDEARRELAQDLLKHNERADLLEGTRLNEAVQRILDRILFLRICEDRDIDAGRSLDRIVRGWREDSHSEAGRRSRQQSMEFREEPPSYSGSSGIQAPKGTLWHALVRHFRALDRRPPSHVPFFNGNLFKPHFSEELVVSDEWVAGFLNDVGDDESPYLFNYIPVEILGTIYERFLGKTVRPHGRGVMIEAKPEVRKAGGVYYTPRYIVEYIVAQTVGKLLADKAPEESLKVRILDPACGSGNFLIRAFEVVCEHCQQWLTDHPKQRKKEWCWTEENSVHLTTKAKRRILRETIHGVDLDPQAVEVTQLSLYLKMLEGENRATQARERDLFGDDEPLLPALEDNIKCGNSLIASDFSLVPEDLVRVRAFDWGVQFAGIMKAGGFDAVIGNPPYIPMEAMADDERVYYSATYVHVERKFDTGVVFILRALRLINPKGFVGYISSITWQTGENHAKLRRYMFEERGVVEVINLPFNTFADAYVDAGVYILCACPRSEYRVYSYPKKAVISSLRGVQCARVSSSLVTPPEFRLVLDPVAQGIMNRCVNSGVFKTFGDLTVSTQGLAADRYQRSGVQRSSEWYPFGEQVQAYRYDFVVVDKTFACMRDVPSLKRFYEAQPKLLLRRIINRQDRIDACYCDEQMVFKKDINPFVLTAPFPDAKFLLAVVNSRLISYLYVRTSAIAMKDDFRQTTLAELRRLPIPVPDTRNHSLRDIHDKLVGFAEKMAGLAPKLREAKSDAERSTLQNAISATDRQIDDLVYKLYGLTPEEVETVENSSKAG